KGPRRMAADMLEESNDELKMMKRALSDADSTMANRAHERDRETQDIIDSWGSSLPISREAAKINALARSPAEEVNRRSRGHTFSDRAMRTMRVIARRVVGMTELGVEKPVIADYVGSLADGAKKLEIALRRGTDRSLAEAALSEAAGTLDPRANSDW